MTKRKSRTASIFPSSGNLDADQAWAALIAKRDLELLFWGNGEHLMKNLHAITGKREPSDGEVEYLSEVISGPRRHKR